MELPLKPDFPWNDQEHPLELETMPDRVTPGEVLKDLLEDFTDVEAFRALVAARAALKDNPGCYTQALWTAIVWERG